MTITKKVGFLTVLVVTFLSCTTMWSGFGTMGDAKKFFDKARTNIETFVATTFPQDLEIKLDAGVVTLNKKTPYCLLLSAKENTGIIFDDSPLPNIKSFETKPENYQCKPWAVVGKDFVMIKEKESETRIYQVPKNMKTTINQTMLLDNAKKYLPILQNWGWTIYLMLPVFLLVVVLPMTMLTNFWYSWVLQIAAKIFKLSESEELKNKYWISLFFGALVSAVYLLTGVFFGWQLQFPFATTILVTAAGIVYLKKKVQDQPDNGRNQKPPVTS